MKASIFKIKQSVQRGFTLVEIAIVLVIIGLLLGGVLRGQELINSARVNSIASQQSSIQTAYYGFIDRYKFQPGDLTDAQALSVNLLTVVAKAGTTQGDGSVQLIDSPAFFNNLAQAGFISCSSCTSGVTTGNSTVGATYTSAPITLSGANTMVNVYGQPLVFLYDSVTPIVGSAGAGSIAFLSSSAEATKPLLTTGGGISSSMLAELDRKLDDGVPGGGQFRYSDLYGPGASGFAAGAYSSAATNAFAKCNTTAGSGTTATFTWTSNGVCAAVSLF